MASKQKHRLKKWLFLPGLMLLIALSSNGQERITVNFSKPVYYPLLKSKASVFQEGLPDVPNQNMAMGSLSALGVGVFRPLVNQAARNLIWKEDGEVQVARSSTYQTFIDICHDLHISPLLTLYQTPRDFRANGGLGKEPPHDLAGYSEGIEKFVALYQGSKPMYWEVWNEPQNGNNFLISDDVITDYNAIYSAVAPSIRRGDPDALIVGPAMANSVNIIDGFSQAFIDNVKNNVLPLDYFSIHSYNRFNGTTDRLDNLIQVVRENMGDDFQTLPIVFTEYEHFPSGADSKEKQRPRELSEGAVKWLVDLNYFLEQTDIPFVTWNRYLWKHEGGRPGGLVDYNQRKRPIYHAYRIFGEMPVERKELVMPKELADAGIGGFASAQSDKAGIVIWNDSKATQNFQLSTSTLPFGEGTASLYRIDQNNASYLENSTTDELVKVARYGLNELSDLTLTIPGPGIIYLEIESSVAAYKIETVNAKYIRSWEYTPRTVEGKVTGDYGNFNWKNWTGHIGVKRESGIGLCAVTMDETPDAIGLQFKTFNANPNPADKNALVAIRIDYVLNGSATKSVLIHGQTFNLSRSTPLPWGAGGASGDELIDLGSYLGDNEMFNFSVKKHAPENWTDGSRRIIASFWMENTGTHSQGVGKILKASEKKSVKVVSNGF